ncbi:IgGFc-binding protein-like [Pseudophryne corroboree]|uniref:IgGFc-binding protein-like n=1 Tax=Pseudophryne corroboree TaxID=495146 RepID=UPI0030812ED4
MKMYMYNINMILFVGSTDQVTSLGRKFITHFLQNQNSTEIPQREVLVTGTLPNTTVSIIINKYNFSKVVKVGKGETVRIPITIEKELKGTTKCPHPVVITADADVTVMSSNYRNNSGDVSLIYPVHQLGYEYYIITPQKGPEDQYNEFLVISSENQTTVDIYLKGSVNYNGTQYLKGDKMTIKLEPFQAIQIQSKDDLSGTKVDSNLPAVVIAGHMCAENNLGCSHVYEQLRPVGSWGTMFFIPDLSFQTKYDIVLVMASQKTSIQYQSGEKIHLKHVSAGELIQIHVTISLPLSIYSTSLLQVLLYGTGGTLNGKPFGSFLTVIPGTNLFGLSYELIGQEKFNTNLAVIITYTFGVPGITFDETFPKDIQWKQFPGSFFSWAEYNYGSGISSHMVRHSTVPFGLLSIGYSMNMAYGSTAPCIKSK